MANYLQNYDAQSYLSNPYNLPTQQIIQAIQTRNQYWDSAASNLKNAYQNYLGLDLTRADNHERLNQLMQGVNQNLQQVTKTDLSIGENYGNALSIFDPIIKDDNIMGDNALTKHYKQELATAQNYRTQGDGKEYSETNVRDLSNHLQDFAADKNASNWRTHYAGRSFYTPYTDVSAEIRTIAKDFKPNTTSLSAPMGLDKNGNPVPYMLTKSDKSIIASQYRAFIDAHMSDKAKNQLAIDGRVRYHDNPNALTSDYFAYNQDKISTYNNQVKLLESKIAGATDAEKEELNDRIKTYKSNIDELNIENTKIKAGDLSNITPYRNQIASRLYTNSYMEYLGKASESTNVDIKYTPDQVWKTMYTQEMENRRFNVARETQLQIARERNETQLMIKGLKGINGQSLTGIPTYGVADTSNNSEFGKEKYDELRNNSQKEFSDAVDQFNKRVNDFKEGKIDVTDPKVSADVKSDAVAQFMADPRNKAAVDAYKQAAAKKSSEDQLFSGVEDYVNGQLSTKYPEIYNARKSIIGSIKTGDTLTLKDFQSYEGLTGNSSNKRFSFNLSSDDLQKILNGNHPEFSMGYENKTTGISGPGAVPNTTRVPVIKYQGKSYDFSSPTLANSLINLSKATGNFESKKAELLNQNITRIAGIEKLYQNDKNPYYNAAHQLTLREIAGVDSQIKPDDVILTAKDREGNVYFKVQGDPHINIKGIQDRVKAAGGKYIEADNTFMLPNRYYGSLVGGNSFQDPKLSAIKTLVDFRSSATPNDIFKTSPQQWGDRNFSFKVDLQNGRPTYSIVDPYSGAVFGADNNGNLFSTIEDAALAAQNLGKLNQTEYTNLVRTIGGVPTYLTKPTQ